MKFVLTDEQKDQYIIWQRDHSCSLQNFGAIGGAITFEFTPTGLGMSQSVKCACGASLNLTNYEDW